MKQLTYEQFKDYLLNNGKTWAITTEDFKKIPKGTRLPFVGMHRWISTYNSETGEDLEFDFDPQWLWSEYTGLFEIIPDYPCEDMEYLKAGDLVDISPKLANHPGFNEWVKFKQEMAGQKCLEIMSINCGDYFISTKDKLHAYAISFIYVKPHVPEKETEEEGWEKLKEEYSLETIKKALKSQADKL